VHKPEREHIWAKFASDRYPPSSIDPNACDKRQVWGMKSHSLPYDWPSRACGQMLGLTSEWYRSFTDMAVTQGRGAGPWFSVMR
jgi:hypothetical protein